MPNLIEPEIKKILARVEKKNRPATKKSKAK